MSDRRATIWTALRATAGVAGLSLAGSQIGFGAFAHGAGLSLFEVVFITVVIWALPAQVILIGALSTGIILGKILILVVEELPRLAPVIEDHHRGSTQIHLDALDQGRGRSGVEVLVDE